MVIVLAIAYAQYQKLKFIDLSNNLTISIYLKKRVFIFLNKNVKYFILLQLFLRCSRSKYSMKSNKEMINKDHNFIKNH